MQSVAIWIASQDRDGTPLDPAKREETITTIERAFIRRFGGCTIIPAFGSWPDDATGLVHREPVSIVQSFVPSDANEDEVYADIISLAEMAAGELNQVAVFIAIDGRPECVAPIPVG